MLLRRTFFGVVLSVALIGTQALLPALTPAQAASPTVTLAAKIQKLYPWAHPHFTFGSYDQKQLNLSIYEVGSPQNLGQGIGARILNLYISTLKGQGTYTLTTYVLTTAGAYSDWQYQYDAVRTRLLRVHFDNVKQNVVTSWYLTTGQIAQAAKAGHWPGKGVTLK